MVNLSSQGVRIISEPTLEATEGKILSQSPTDATRFWWHLAGVLERYRYAFLARGGGVGEPPSPSLAQLGGANRTGQVQLCTETSAIYILPALETTQGQTDGVFSQLPYKSRIGWHLWEIDLRFASGLPPGWGRADLDPRRAFVEAERFEEVEDREVREVGDARHGLEDVEPRELAPLPLEQEGDQPFQRVHREFDDVLCPLVERVDPEELGRGPPRRPLLVEHLVQFGRSSLHLRPDVPRHALRAHRPWQRRRPP